MTPKKGWPISSATISAPRYPSSNVFWGSAPEAIVVISVAGVFPRRTPGSFQAISGSGVRLGVAYLRRFGGISSQVRTCASHLRWGKCLWWPPGGGVVSQVCSPVTHLGRSRPFPSPVRVTASRTCVVFSGFRPRCAPAPHTCAVFHAFFVTECREEGTKKDRRD